MSIKAKVLQLQEERTAKLRGVQELLNAIKTGTPAGEQVRDLTSEEEAQLDTLNREIDDLSVKIEKSEKLLNAEKMARLLNVAGGVPIQDADVAMEKASQRFNVAKFIRESPQGGQGLTGLEKEMHQEAVNESRELGLRIEGAGLPSKMIRFSSKFRGMNVEAADTHGGEFVVGEDRRGIVPVLSIDPIAAELGVTIFPNQTNDLYFVIGSADASSSFVTEIQAAPESDVELIATAWKPIRNTTKQLISGRTLMQDTVGVQNYIRERLSEAVSRSVDDGIIRGSGGGQLTGVLNQANVNEVIGGTNGATLTRAHILELKRKLMIANSSKNNIKYISNYYVEDFLKTLALDSGSGRFVWPDMGNMLNGAPWLSSNHIPNNLVKGDSGAVCSAIIVGDWSKYYLAQFGGLDIIVDEVTAWDTDQVKIGIKTYWDGKAVQPACFSIMEDAKLT